MYIAVATVHYSILESLYQTYLRKWGNFCLFFNRSCIDEVSNSLAVGIVTTECEEKAKEN
jgi:hypothetical protein